MASECTEIGVVVALRSLGSRWGETVRQPCAVLAAAPPLAPGTPLDQAGRLIYAGSTEVALVSALTDFYGDNLAGGDPVVWVALGPDEAGGGQERIVGATVDPDEGETLTADPLLTVEAVPMPDELRQWVGDFVTRFPATRFLAKRIRRRAEET